MNPSYKLIANTIRGLSMDAIGQANSGHPGLPLGMADVAAVLWHKFLKHNPKNPAWYDRDRFVLSGGHGSMLIYSLLHIFGYDLPLAEIKNFRQWGSKTPGHPENFVTKGIETTTGPLGQGVANAVGMALAETSLAARYNSEKQNITNHYTYVFLGDGDLQEGVSHEASSFAGHNKLGKLIAFYDSNSITIDGKTDLSFSENVAKRFEAYGWHTIGIDGHDYAAIETAIETAQNQTDKPTMIICTTTIGYGSPNRGGTSKAHGEPFPEDEIKLTKKNLGLPEDLKFYVTEEIASIQTAAKEKGAEWEQSWQHLFEEYAVAHPQKATEFSACLSGYIPENAFDFTVTEDASMATRKASGAVLNQLAPLMPSLMGGSADLTPSNNTLPKSETGFSPENPTGRYIYYGVREFGMAAIMNGLALHGGVQPYAGTFFVFTDYMRSAMRMSALMKLPVIYVLTHDSIGLGEDGPTHQPIEQLSGFRAMPNMLTMRPMDAEETKYCWQVALTNKKSPSCLVLTRQNLPVYNRAELKMSAPSETLKGAYVLFEDEGFNTVLLASGSEVEIAINAKALLNEKGIKVRVISVPCMELFETQTAEYQESVMAYAVKSRVAVEAGSSQSWWKYVGHRGKVVALDRFGGSAPYKVLYEKLGLTPENVAKAALDLV